jgi:hypothetical protein
MTNTTKYELKGFKIYHKDNKSKYDQRFMFKHRNTA